MPDTCLCPPEWSGHDCSIPVCLQGYMVADPQPELQFGTSSARSWVTYVPCEYKAWCTETNGFDCAQERRTTVMRQLESGPVGRSITGLIAEEDNHCVMMEISTGVRNNYQRLDSYGRINPHMRFPPATNYTWQGENTWSSPLPSAPDRQVILVEQRIVTQGPYTCANGGFCAAPGLCLCKQDEWIGFDCRIPVCNQGYYEPRFTNKHNAGYSSSTELRAAHPDGRTSGVGTTWAERYKFTSGTPGDTPIDQGWYSCSARAYTEWENPDYIHDHPNYFSRYMDGPALRATTGEDEHVYYWEGMDFPRLHSISAAAWDETDRGFHRTGTWSHNSGVTWQKGKCTPEYSRQCGIQEIQRIYLSANTNKTDSSAGGYLRPGGTFRIMFDPDSRSSNMVTSDIDADTSAADLQVALEALDTVGAVTVTKRALDPPNDCPRSNQAYGLAPCLGCSGITSDTWPDGELRTSCFGWVWEITFVTNLDNVPSLLVSADPWDGYTYGYEAVACDDDRKIACSLLGGYMSGDPPAYSGRGTTVYVTTVVQGSASSFKARDARNYRIGRPVYDTDAAYRPRITGYDTLFFANSRWNDTGGSCVDFVVRGCYNNGTCIAPNRCQCAPGWSGYDCSIPVCAEACRNGGNCTLPNTCTCEKGWSGHDCTIPLCAQECNNGGRCVAPDKCECKQWRSLWRDEREAGGQPLFRDEFGDARFTGWTGFDCSTPICVNAENFTLNDPIGRVRLGGRSTYFPDELLKCIFNESGTPTYVPGAGGCYLTLSPRYRNVAAYGILFGQEPFNNLMGQSMIGHLGGYPVDYTQLNSLAACPPGLPDTPENPCDPTKGRWSTGAGQVARNDGRSYQSGCARISPAFEESPPGHTNRMWGTDDSHRVRGWGGFWEFGAMNFTEWERTSADFLCRIMQWEEGDYMEQGLHLGHVHAGRGIRRNHIAYLEPTPEIFIRDPYFDPYGEGIYMCYNQGSCVSPDLCACTDGYTGPSCTIPLCRHIQRDISSNNQVVGCLNAGVCGSKDRCSCPQVPSILEAVHPDARDYPLFPPYRGLTGWNGTDCSIPICVQGYYDATCTGITPGGEGCFRCANGGICTAPDVCTCAPGWRGYDCTDPVCNVVADAKVVTEVGTIDIYKVQNFELNPCQHYETTRAPENWGKFEIGRGNCTKPNHCTCTCYEEDPEWLPWEDSYGRPLLFNEIFGRFGCADGWEGILDKKGFFLSCHQKIKVPSMFEAYTTSFIIGGAIFTVIVGFAYWRFKKYMRRRYLLKKAERRRSRKSSESSLSNGPGMSGARRSSETVGALR